MSRIAYVNGRYVPHRSAAVHIEDRACQFGDGVYEVIAVRRGALVDETRHLDRLDRSLNELRIAAPHDAGRSAYDPARSAASQPHSRRYGLFAGEPRRRAARSRFPG